MGNSKGGIGIFTSFGFELYVMFFSKQGGGGYSIGENRRRGYS